MSRIITGARLLMYVNGAPYAGVRGIKWDSDTPRKEARGIDSSEPYELMPTTTRINGVITVYRLANSGGAEGAGFTADFSAITREKYFTLTIIDRTTDTQVFRADHCSLNGQSWDAEAKGLLMGVLKFEGLTWNNEAVEHTVPHLP